MRFILFLCLCLAMVSCNTYKTEPDLNPPTDTDIEGFYTINSGSFMFKYKSVENQILECKLSGNTSGWLAIGFDPTELMKDANFIIGFVTDGIAVIRDDFGTTPYTHEPDTSLGGTDDVTLLTSSETSGTTSLHFQIPLNSGDSKDRILSLGNSYKVILASGSEDDFSSNHTQTATAYIAIR